MNNPCNKCEHAYKQRVKNGYYSHPGFSCFCCDCKKYSKYAAYRSSKRLYVKGEPINSIQDFEAHISDKYMFWGDTVKHVAFLESLQYAVLKRTIKMHYLYRAVPRLIDEINNELSRYNKTLEDAIWVWCGESLTTVKNFIEKVTADPKCYFAEEAQKKIAISGDNWELVKKQNLWVFNLKQ